VNETTSIVADTTARIFADLADPQAVNRAADTGWKAALWQALAEAGLPLAWVDERCGGAGASLADGFEIIGISGRYAAPVPLAETLLAGAMLARAGIVSPSGMMTIAPARPDDRIALAGDGTLSGRARGVPFAADAGYVVVLAGSSVALVETAACRIVEGRSLAGDPLDDVTFDRVRPLQVAAAPVDFDQHALMLLGAAVRSVQSAGALDAVLQLCVRYANERVAFERPIAKFQAVQHNLARLAGEVAAAMTAAGSAADAVANAAFGDEVFLEVAAAKIRSAEAAQEGAAIAHQVHGAIGFTKEHILHRFTLRLLAWRDDFGNESHWAVALGNKIAERGADEFWPLVASR
jgi:alkylation response protein AidB-like acyl-CoA dehydrogenase